MKRVVSIVVGVMFSLLCVASGQDVEQQTNDAQQKCVKSDSAACVKKTRNFSKRAAYYQDKAAGEKNKDLAAIYSKCAEAKKKIADGHAKMNAKQYFLPTQK